MSKKKRTHRSVIQKVMCQVTKLQADKLLESNRQWYYVVERPHFYRSELYFCVKKKELVVGYMVVEVVYEDSPKTVWSLTGAESGIAKIEYFRLYGNCRQVSALRVVKKTIFDEPMPPSAFGVDSREEA